MKYSKAQREEAIALAAESNANAASKKLGISYGTLYNWVKESKNKPANDQSDTPPDLQDIAQPEPAEPYQNDTHLELVPQSTSAITAEEQVRVLEKENQELLQTVQRLNAAISALLS